MKSVRAEDLIEHAHLSHWWYLLSTFVDFFTCTFRFSYIHMVVHIFYDILKRFLCVIYFFAECKSMNGMGSSNASTLPIYATKLFNLRGITDRRVCELKKKKERKLEWKRIILKFKEFVKLSWKFIKRNIYFS